MFTLHPNRSLLNPKFDGYKLDPISSEDAIVRHVLKHEATQASASGHHRFSFQEAESRIRHNHLTVSPDGAHAVYIDADLRVISVRLLNHPQDRDALQPSFTAIHDISQPTQAQSFVSHQTEYPSSAFVDAQILICANGRGTLDVLTLSSTDTARLLGVYELPRALSASSFPIPFRLHTALSADGQAVAVLSFKRLGESPPDASSGRKTVLVEFDIVAVRIPLQATDSSDTISPLEILWHRRGSRVPFYTAYDKHRRALIIAGGSPYRPIGQPTTAERHDPSSDEFAPAPASPPKPPPPYAWTQDSEEITVAFPFPSSTPKANITVLFSPQTLTLLVKEGSDGDEEPATAPRYAATRLWGGITPSSSFWTWDAHGGGGGGGTQAYGLLTLHIEKQHAGTRWPHLFDTNIATNNNNQTKTEPEVPETLDPSELHAIRESLEKYTAALQEGGHAGVGAGAMPSLADGEVDQEVDAAVGTETCITWVPTAAAAAAAATADGDPDSDPAWAREDWDVPFTALSAPLPGIGNEISMVVKHSIDGLLFVLSDDDNKAGGTPVWTHSSTFSALAFVLASKRDTRFTYHVPSKAVLAFEGGGPEYGGNLYIYRDAKPKSNLAKQAILKLTGHTSGSLLGVGAIRNREEVFILCLCERELLVLRNVL